MLNRARPDFYLWRNILKFHNYKIKKIWLGACQIYDSESQMIFFTVEKCVKFKLGISSPFSLEFISPKNFISLTPSQGSQPRSTQTVINVSSTYHASFSSCKLRRLSLKVEWFTDSDQGQLNLSVTLRSNPRNTISTFRRTIYTTNVECSKSHTESILAWTSSWIFFKQLKNLNFSNFSNQKKKMKMVWKFWNFCKFWKFDLFGYWIIKLNKEELIIITRVETVRT